MKTSTRGIKTFSELPKNAQEYIKGLEKFIEKQKLQVFLQVQRDRDTILIENLSQN